MFLKNKKTLWKNIQGIFFHSSAISAFFFSATILVAGCGSDKSKSKEEFCVSGGSHEVKNTCGEVLALQTTHVRTKQDIINQIDNFEEVYRHNAKEAGFDLGIGIDIPIDGIPVPFDFSGSADFSKNDIEKTLNHYQELYNFNFEEERDMSFLDPSQITAWLACQNDNRQGPKMKSEYEIKGDKIFFSVALETNFKSSKVRECTYTNGGGIIRYEDPATRKELDILHSGEVRSFSFSIDTLKPFIFRLVTDCFEPVTLYVPEKPKLAGKIDYAAERSIEIVEPENLEELGAPSNSDFKIRVTDHFGQPLLGQTIYVRSSANSPDYNETFHFSANKYFTGNDGMATASYMVPGMPKINMWVKLEFSLDNTFTKENSVTAKYIVHKE